MPLYREKCPLISLPYLKKRLRRITAFGVHDLVVHEFRFTVHFTLHLNEKSSAFYASESVEDQRSPEWRHLEFPLPFQCVEDFFMRIWITTPSRSYLSLEYDIHLDHSLVPDEQKERLRREPNTLWFEMFNYRYTDTDDDEERLTSKERPIFADSYNRSSIHRLLNTFNEIRECQQGGLVQLALIDKCVESNKEYLNQINACESTQVRIGSLKQYIKFRKYRNEQARFVYRQRLSDFEDRKARFNDRLSELQYLCQTANISISRFQQSELVLRNYLLINKYRRREILCEIYRYIYPIEKDSQNRYQISNVKLPPVNDQIYLYKLSREHEREITAAVTYCSHLIVLLSDLICLPLRFPIDLYDPSTVKIYDFSADPNEYPLQLTTNLNAFLKGFFLLNLNIGQMMHHCRIGDSNDSVQNTLENLKKLIEQHFIKTMSSIPSRLKAMHGLDESMLVSKRHSISSFGSSNLSLMESNSNADEEGEFQSDATPRLAMQILHQIQN